MLILEKTSPGQLPEPTPHPASHARSHVVPARSQESLQIQPYGFLGGAVVQDFVITVPLPPLPFRKDHLDTLAGWLFAGKRCLNLLNPHPEQLCKIYTHDLQPRNRSNVPTVYVHMRVEDFIY